ncbi:MAG: ATP-dependent 6-phosphofructokinase [Thiofilum sp.]|uniref:ATP-dependent 6-phosphofructokinase n=1 Tax=Thiofilum sp. TaxID=2212733 RepID=UPI0025D2AF45|nr:ATP-dependent 6-phosphofructokinase [Thiofilum sp.]MBK8452185.1 ATP-dependent 6-phosphofructokinase [Thiofilum sp.]
MQDLIIDQFQPCSVASPLKQQPSIKFRSDQERMLVQPELSVLEACLPLTTQLTLELAGPRAELFFNPKQVKAAIVTCGGLCPGLNAVIRGLVMQLWHLYGCRHIKGIRYGYHGLGQNAEEPLVLTPDLVSGLKAVGGTMLGSSRGTPPTEELVDSLVRRGINMLFAIGGDGTMRGAQALWEEIRRRDLTISVIGIPKTIDNDIPWVRRSFGFDTAVAEAVKAINVAEIEAKGMQNGIGIVKLMGRHAGFITATACVASGNANLCLIPEVPFTLEGEQGVLALVERRLRERHHAVIVVAEGAGQDLVHGEGRDASGNAKLGDIGLYLKQQMTAYFKDSPLDVGIKYIEPSYLIRSAPPTASDQLYCDQLARAAVHAAMAGKGGMLLGDWNGRITHVPIQALAGKSRKVNPNGELWFSVRENTGQPAVIG